MRRSPGSPAAGCRSAIRGRARPPCCATSRQPWPGRWTAPYLPLFESLPRLLREGTFLLDRVVRRLERAGQPAQGLGEALDRVGRDGRLLLLFDGLDEVPKESREDAEQLLRDLAVRWPATPIVVTSRPIGYRSLAGGFREVEVLSLDRASRHELLARLFGRGSGSPGFARADGAMGVGIGN